MILIHDVMIVEVHLLDNNALMVQDQHFFLQIYSTKKKMITQTDVKLTYQLMLQNILMHYQLQMDHHVKVNLIMIQ